MAQLNITLNQEEMLQLLSEDRDKVFRKLLENSLNALLQVESAEQLGAEPYERSATRTDSRNGTRERELTTRIGKITLKVPRHRNQPFKTMLFENYSRSEQALISTMAEMVVNGVSTRKIGRIMETLCGTGFSKSSVSEYCKELDRNVNAFRRRELTKDYPFIMVDATYFKVRIEKRVLAKAFMVAVGTTIDGKREILGFEAYDAETKDSWKAFFESLKTRGLKNVRLITSDAHEGIIYGISSVFPTVPWQRCQTHFSRNILDKAPKQYQTAIHEALTEMYNCRTIEAARKKRDEIITEYEDVAEAAMQCLDEGFESVMTIMVFPKTMRRYFRTTNHLERLNKELKRRSNVIGIFPSEESLLRLMGSVLIEWHENPKRQRGFRFDKMEAATVIYLDDKLKKIAREQYALLKVA